MTKYRCDTESNALIKHAASTRTAAAVAAVGIFLGVFAHLRRTQLLVK